MLKVHSDSCLVKKCTIKEGSGHPGQDVIGITLNGANFTTIDSCKVRNIEGGIGWDHTVWAGKAIGILMTDSQDNIIKNSSIKNCVGGGCTYPQYANNGYGVYIDDCPGLTISDCVVSSIHSGSSTIAPIGIHMDGSPNSSITGCKVKDISGNGIKLTTTSINIFLSNNIITNLLTGIVLNQSANALIGGELGQLNQIYNNSNWNLVNYTPNDINATYNYWGTANEDSIALSIYDCEDNGSYGCVDYSNWLPDTDIDDSGFILEVPTNDLLSQNYPNPFNPQTTISFNLAEAVEITLDIYDVSGKLVKRLANEPKEIGYHSVIWDGKNEEGESVGSGVYFYKLKTGTGYNETKRMILLK